MFSAGQVIREARQRAGLTQAELAERLGTTQSAVARWEAARGDVRVDTIQAAVAACGLSLSIALNVGDDSDRSLAGQLANLSDVDRTQRHAAVASRFRAMRNGVTTPINMESERILEVLNDHDVEYVVIGGMAAIVAGSPFPTEDIDITPATSAENLSRLSDALRVLSAQVRLPDGQGVPFAHNGDSLADVTVLTLTTTYGALDICITPAGTRGFEDLKRDARERNILGVTVLVASLADVIRSKEAAGRDKDHRVLPTLREILRRDAVG